jgi:prepilin-type processing-associated H-X9-DG protein
MYWQDWGRGSPRDASGDFLWYRRCGASKTSTADIRICPTAREPVPPTFQAPGIRIVPDAGTAANCWSMPGEPAVDPKYDSTGSYALNGWVLPSETLASKPTTPSGPDAETAFMSESAIRFASRTPVFADATWLQVWPRTNDWAGDLFFGGGYPEAQSTTISCVTIGRHGSKPPVSARGSLPRGGPLPRIWGVNVVFYDGHSERIRLPDLWTLTWNRAWVPGKQPGVL